MERERLTEKTLRALRPGDTVSDLAVRGLRARRQRKGIVFELRYKDPVFGKRRSAVVGKWGPGQMTLKLEDEHGAPTGQILRIGDPRELSVTAIRAKAVEMLASLKAGHDPRLDVSAKGMTLQQAFQLHLERMTRRGRSPVTIEDYRYKHDHYLDDWKDAPLSRITRPMVRKKHNELSVAHGPYAANSAMRAFRAFWNTARKHDETLGESPTIAVEMHPEHARDTAMQPENLAQWHARVMRLGNPVPRDFHLFLLFTGLRRTSAATVKWEHVDFEKGTLRIPAPKGGEKRAFTMPLSDYLVDLLKARKADNADRFPKSPYVFPSADSESGHIEEARPTRFVVVRGKRQKVRDASLPSPHALRHTFAAICEHRVVIPHLHTKLLLNHAPPRSNITWQYAGAGDTEALRVSMQKVTDYLRTCLEPTPSAEVIPLPQRAGTAIKVA